MELRKLIEEYEPFDEQETKDKEVILKWIDTFDDVLTRKNEFAHFTSSAFVINKARNKILMVHHNIYNSWTFPGGHAEGESNLLTVALKEVQEETGVKNIKPVMNEIFLLDTLPALGHFKKGKYVPAHTDLHVTYLIEADEFEPLIIQEEENSGVEWIPIEEIIEKTNLLYMKHLFAKAIKKLNFLN